MTRARNLSRLGNLSALTATSGNLGIGSTNPGTKLTVVGDGNFTGVITATSFSGNGANLTGLANTDFISAQDVTVSGVVTATSFSGNGANLTGIGGTDFISAVNVIVSSASTLSGPVSIADSITHVGDNSAIRFPANDTFTVETAGSEAIRIDTDGNVGINSTDPIAKLDVDGDVNISGVATATQFDSTSDVALKENIEVIDNPIIKLSELKGVTFDWKAGGHSIGVIAQDVEKVLPTAVGGSKSQKTVNYNVIIGLLVESVKDQQKQIEELKSLLDK